MICKILSSGTEITWSRMGRKLWGNVLLARIPTKGLATILPHVCSQVGTEQPIGGGSNIRGLG